MLKTYLEIGKITSPHGVRGEVKLEVWSDSPESLLKVKKVSYNANGEGLIKVESSRPHKGRLLLKLEGINDMDAANALRSKVLYAHRDSILKSKDSFFINDLIGLEVTDVDTSVSYGKLTDVIETGANDVYVVTDEKGKQRLVPAIKQVVIETDLEGSVMKIRPLEGLFDED